MNTSDEVSKFASNGYALLRNLVPESACSFLYEYARKSGAAGRLNIGDTSVPETPNCYADAFMESLLEVLLPRIELESELKLFPTYSYFRVYKHRDVLDRHHDRPSCEVSVTLSLGYAPREPWPIWIDVGGEAKSYALEPGDGLLYKGIELDHWRDRFEGDHAVQVFLHYVDQNGPNRHMKYDMRKGLHTLPMTGRIIEKLMSSANRTSSL